MSAANLAAETNNFLLPNGTFIVESLIILVVLFIFFRFIVPPPFLRRPGIEAGILLDATQPVLRSQTRQKAWPNG